MYIVTDLYIVTDPVDPVWGPIVRGQHLFHKTAGRASLLHSSDSSGIRYSCGSSYNSSDIITCGDSIDISGINDISESIYGIDSIESSGESDERESSDVCNSNENKDS